MDSAFAVTITTAEEFRLLEQEDLEVSPRRDVFSGQSNQIWAASTDVGSEQPKGWRSISRTVGFTSVAISLVGVGILVLGSKMSRFLPARVSEDLGKALNT
jgi:hypothetical protein